MKTEEEKKSKLRDICRECGEPVDEINTLCKECERISQEWDEIYDILAMY
tara:strand:+ start:1034 stop:1183 length:150 start_codon:yes stop_codon:yes gene_type:complete